MARAENACDWGQSAASPADPAAAATPGPAGGGKERQPGRRGGEGGGEPVGEAELPAVDGRAAGAARERDGGEFQVKGAGGGRAAGGREGAGRLHVALGEREPAGLVLFEIARQRRTRDRAGDAENVEVDAAAARQHGDGGGRFGRAARGARVAVAAEGQLAGRGVALTPFDEQGARRRGKQYAEDDWDPTSHGESRAGGRGVSVDRGAWCSESRLRRFGAIVPQRPAGPGSFT